jgi:hypothetical protein
MKTKMQAVPFIVAAFLILICSVNGSAEVDKAMVTEVASLNLGMNGYAVGKKLTVEQKKIAGENPLEGAYEGTYKFTDNNLNVVVAVDTDMVLAMYRQVKEANKEQVKVMVAELMDLFGEPTTIAHGKILYWAFNRHGAVTEDTFNKAKEIKQAAGLGVIATVKLSSERDITPDPIEEKKGEHGKEKVEETGAVYFIITSDPLVKQFME